MVKGVWEGAQKEPGLPDKGVDPRESSRGEEVCVSTPRQLLIYSILSFKEDLNYATHEARVSKVDEPSQTNC